MRSSSEISRAETTRQHSFRHVLTAHERYNKSSRYLHNVCTRHTIVLGWHQLHSSLKRSLSKKLNTSSNVSFKNSSVRHFEKRNSSWSHRDYRVPGRNKTAAREKQKNKKKLFLSISIFLSIYLSIMIRRRLRRSYREQRFPVLKGESLQLFGYTSQLEKSLRLKRSSWKSFHSN